MVCLFHCLSNRHGSIDLFPIFHSWCNASTATFRRGNDDGVRDNYRVRRVFELLGDVRNKSERLAFGVRYQDIQETEALAGQFAEGVEAGLERPCVPVDLHGEKDGGGLLAHLAQSEEIGSGLVGDEGIDARDIFYSLDVLHLETVGLNNRANRRLDGDDMHLVGVGRDLHHLLRHQQVVGSVDNRSGGCGGVLLEHREYRQLHRCDVAGVGLQRADVALAAYLRPFGIEGVHDHVVRAGIDVQRAAIGTHVLHLLEVAVLDVVETDHHVSRYVNLRMRLLADIHVDVEVEFQVELQHEVGLGPVVVVVAEVLVLAGGQKAEGGSKKDEGGGKKAGTFHRAPPFFSEAESFFSKAAVFFSYGPMSHFRLISALVGPNQ